MPWRKNICTKFELADSSSCSEEGQQRSDFELCDLPDVPADLPEEEDLREDEPVLPSEDLNRLVAKQFLSRPLDSEIKLPWEVGPFQSLFSDGFRDFGLDGSNPFTRSSWVPTPFLEAAAIPGQDPQDVVGIQADNTGYALYEQAVMAFDDMSFSRSQAEMMHIAVSKWVSIVSYTGVESEAGKQVLLGVSVGKICEDSSSQSQQILEIFCAGLLMSIRMKLHCLLNELCGVT